MNVHVNIQLSQNEYASDLSGNSTEIADAVLKAIGGDEEKDTVNVLIQDSGAAGVNALPTSPLPTTTETLKPT